MPLGDKMRFDRQVSIAASEPFRARVAPYANMARNQNGLLGRDRQSRGTMPAIEVWGRRGYEIVTLSESVYTVGSDAECAGIVVDDSTVSQVHLILERVGATWLARDLGSRNGTKVAGERLLHQRRLRDGDEILVGRTRLVFRDAGSARRPKTETLESPPDDITRGEKKVLVELCRPLLQLNAFTPPATCARIAQRLFVGPQAVKAHLARLYDKFDIATEPGVNRRVVLANEAVQRGAVTLADLEASARDEDARRLTWKRWDRGTK